MKSELSKLAVYSYLIDAIHIDAKIFELEYEELRIKEQHIEGEVFDKERTFERLMEKYEKGDEQDVKEVIRYIEDMHTVNYYHNYIDLGITYKWRPL